MLPVSPKRERRAFSNPSLLSPQELQRNFIVGGKPGITDAEYEVVARRFAAVGIKPV